MKSFRTTMIASVAAFSLGAGTVIALSGLLPIAGASTSNCPNSPSAPVAATTHHASAGAGTSAGASASAGSDHDSTGNGATRGGFAPSGSASTGVNVEPSSPQPLISVNAGTNGSSSASAATTPGDVGITVNGNTGNAGTGGLVRSILGTVANAHQGNGASGVNGLVGGSGLLNGNGLLGLGGLSLSGNVSSTGNN